MKPWQQFQGRWDKGRKPGRTRRGPQAHQHVPFQHVLINRGGVWVDGKGNPVVMDGKVSSSYSRRLWWRVYRELGLGPRLRTTWRTDTEAAEVQARWDQRRMERATAQATNTRRPGRL